MKKFIAFLLVTVMVALALVSCNGDTGKETEAPSQKPTQSPSETQKPTDKDNGMKPSQPTDDDELSTEDNKELYYTREGNTVYFGEYPQSKVTELELNTALTEQAGALPSADNSNSWTSYGYYKDGAVSNYMWYIDIEKDGARYRGVYFTEYRPLYTSSNAENGTFQDENGYHPSNVYWFKYEPIAWTVLSEKDGTALVVCNMIIDSREYQNKTQYDPSAKTEYIKGTTIYSNDYKHSVIREWLNDSFYNTAFSEDEEKIILVTTVDNSVESTGYESNKYVCEDTQDKVFLLSGSDVTNEAYGFLSKDNYSDSARQKKTTGYAQAMGAFTGDSIGSAYYTHGWWWLRSPCDDYQYGYARVAGGTGTCHFGDLIDTSGGVVPALTIKLS